MNSHIILGRNGEELAAAYLLSKGYTVLHKNWRHSYYEIDIIAQKGNKTHFVEVKTRKNSNYGYPEESVTKRKFKFLQKAVDEYLQQYPEIKWIQYDILSIIWNEKNSPEYFLLEDVYL
jgi:putative endonuclease